MHKATTSAIDQIYSVRDVMTPTTMLVRADDRARAELLLGDYDVIPYPEKGRIRGYFCREDKNLTMIDASHLISDGTRLIDLPEMLSDAPFYFVISGNSISGYVHYSDLNKPAMRMPVFAHLQEMERRFWDKVQRQLTTDIVRSVFPDKLAAQFVRRKERARGGNVDVGWIGVFSLPNILALARHFEATTLSDEEIDLLRKVRNCLAHSDQNLIVRQDDVRNVAAVIRLCRSPR